jgi:hypothetical protein
VADEVFQMNDQQLKQLARTAVPNTMRESTLLEQSRTNDLAFATARKD